MLREGFQHALVVELGAVVGVISDREVLAAMSPDADSRFASRHELASLDKRAHQIMGRSPLRISTDATMAEAAALLLERRVHCLPVFHGQRCVGTLSSGDVISWALELARESAGEHVVAASR